MQLKYKSQESFLNLNSNCKEGDREGLATLSFIKAQPYPRKEQAFDEKMSMQYNAIEIPLLRGLWIQNLNWEESGARMSSDLI